MNIGRTITRDLQIEMFAHFMPVQAFLMRLNFVSPFSHNSKTELTVTVGQFVPTHLRDDSVMAELGPSLLHVRVGIHLTGVLQALDTGQRVSAFRAARVENHQQTACTPDDR